METNFIFLLLNVVIDKLLIRLIFATLGPEERRQPSCSAYWLSYTHQSFSVLFKVLVKEKRENSNTIS